MMFTVRLTDQQYQKLNEILDKLGIGNDKSEKFRNFIEKLHSELGLTNKEEFLKNIQNNAEYTQLPMTQYELQKPCPYHTITEEGTWYCDIKKIPKAVCIARQKRYLYMNKQCKPEHFPKPKPEPKIYMGKGWPY